ncbi:probable serine racemase isoform X2 [Homarus americanus]|uniref:Serine racemase n=2 Tax=Homarus americanus TaxID=6706 RepID=A0A8J5TC98_HOMAM|nr:probable serine racemase isoform X2 [Homarus americanus]XP_042216389.1 probable serine racemase isoform X2 [Homarus americanus]XP_042216390.1 probable serine racemase isoform X2 [Homarus americanus]XP_042216391.1 probable serine racemase isoform X2 [Homarus americanus]XP_042216392.1 probable serine racemase isoform X2 [Homarus americanus]XP_042216393.1 probable serine racemase isoform X2 [Homarus americanus]XP_042216394.1 probable serine racemase isoform X2 [Homarus americanus]KAG7171842.
MPAPFGLKEVREAYMRISGCVHRTPVLKSQNLDSLAGRQLYFKAENLQKTGSFKARGACNAVLLEKEKRPNSPGVVTHSSGNHGQAVAYAARCAGLPCSVVVPKGTPQVKCDAIRDYGAELVFCEASPASRNETCAEISSKTGRAVIHPFDNFDVMAGQGTIALELLEEVPDLDAVLVPISGGGMTSGIAVATKGMQPNCKVYPVEPYGKLLQRCLQSKQRMWPNPPQFIDTIADAIRTQQVGNLTFPILCEYAEPKVFTITDDQMIEGMKLGFERMKMVVEAASGAAIYAAVKSIEEVDAAPEKVGVILCGGNVDLDHLPWFSRKTSY